MNNDVIRLFVAVDPPPVAVAHLAAVVDTLEVSQANAPGRSTRLAARDRWHVTLAFLGRTPAADVAVAAEALERAVNANAICGAVPIEVGFAGGGTFGRGSSTIVWAGLGGDLIALHRLADAVRRELRRAQLAFDRKNFRPHLTLSRPGTRIPRELMKADVATLSTYVGPRWPIDAVYLVQSILGPIPRHSRLATVRLT